MPVSRSPVPASGGRFTPAQREKAADRLQISVVFTDPVATVRALRHAGVLAAALNAQIALLATQVVPYPLPLEEPRVPLTFSRATLERVAEEAAVPTTVRIYLCRERLETLISVLPPGSMIVMGGRRRWWLFSPEQRLARNLRRAGHEVIFREME